MDVESHFLDSGAFSLNPKAKEYAEKTGDRWGFFNTPLFWRYMKRYVRFVKKYKIAIDLYANVDVIGNAELTWRNQQWLEKRGLEPVPVVHYDTDPKLKWLKHYINKGYELIGLGGLVSNMGTPACRKWIDNCFEYICNNPERLPCVKLHGFGVSNFRLLVRYPWWSVDSTTWIKVGGYGNILVPHKRKGEFTFKVDPYIIAVSTKSRKMEGGLHYLNLNPVLQAIIKEWLEYIDVPLGKGDGEKEEDRGVTNNRYARVKANLLFFEKLRDSIPEWPWPWNPKRKRKKSLL